MDRPIPFTANERKILDGHADSLMEFNKDLGWVFADRIDPAVLDAWGVPKPAAAALTASASAS